MSLDPTLFREMAYALGIGVLIGLERSFQPAHAGEAGPEDEPSPAAARRGSPEFMGVRTFSVLSLFGYGAALVSERYPAVAPLALAAAALLVVASYLRSPESDTGITTEAAALATCGLGILCHQSPETAGVLALVLTVLLASKRFAYDTIRRMRWVELTDTLKFLAVILIALPLLPRRALDPWGAFNPYKVGFLVVLISGLSFVGYFLTRILGARRGLGLTGVLGGLTSSTAVTAAMAAQARQSEGLRAICAFSTLAANATMFARVLVVVAVLDLTLARRLAWSVGTMAVVAATAAILLWLVASRRQGEEGTGQVRLRNPFSLGPALKFAAFFVAILFAARIATAAFGDRGLYAAAALSGLADVDAITLSIAEQTRGAALAREVGALGVTIAVVANSVVKSAIAITSGGFGFGRLVALGLGLATAAGLAVAIVL